MERQLRIESLRKRDQAWCLNTLMAARAGTTLVDWTNWLNCCVNLSSSSGFCSAKYKRLVCPRVQSIRESRDFIPLYFVPQRSSHLLTKYFLMIMIYNSSDHFTFTRIWAWASQSALAISNDDIFTVKPRVKILLLFILSEIQRI